MKRKSKRVAPERFTRGVVQTVQNIYDTKRDHFLWTDWFELDGTSYNVETIHLKDKIYWGLRDIAAGGHFVGGGWFVFQTRPRRVLRELRAALWKAHRGRGIYPRILKALRRQFRRPLESDIRLSSANIKAWEKVARFDLQSERFRMNPRLKPIPIADQVRFAWLATEGYVP